MHAGGDAALAAPTALLPEIWEDPGELAELAPGALVGFDRLKHLDLAGSFC